MGSQELKNALRDAGLTPEEFAQVIQVDPKSVTRWLTGQATPYPRHRAKIARALDRTEKALWPEVTGPEDHQPVAGSVEVSEVTGAWGYADQETIPDIVAFITASTGPIDLLSTGHGLEVNLPVVSALLEQADQRRPVRVITTKRKPTFTALLEHPQIQVRYLAKLGVDHSLLRAGDQLLFTFFMQPASQEPPALLKLDRSQNDGLFDRLTHGYTGLWEEAVQTITTAEQLHATGPDADSDQHDQENEKSASEPSARGQRTTAKPGDPTSPVQPATDDGAKPPPRRWPRRPD